MDAEHETLIGQVREEAEKARWRYDEHKATREKKEALEAEVLERVLAASSEALPTVVSRVQGMPRDLLKLAIRGQASNAYTLWVDATGKLFECGVVRSDFAECSALEAMTKYELRTCVQSLLAELSKTLYRQTAVKGLKKQIDMLELILKALR